MVGPVKINLPLMSEGEWLEAAARTDAEWSRVQLPAGWIESAPPALPLAGARFARRGKTSAVFSAGRHDGKLWLHVSIGHPNRMPSYLELAEAKRIFIGESRQALQVFSPAAKHINIHRYVLHLWCCLEPEGDGLPDFGRYGTI